MNFTAWEGVLAAFGALLVGVSKTGITGLSLLFVPVFAAAMPARRSTGVVLPLLIVGDLVAFATYRRHAVWTHVWRLLPWACAGIVIGYLALQRMDDRQVSVTIGIIVVGLTGVHVLRRARPGPQAGEASRGFASLIGVLAGFTTLVSNASGPLVVIYLLAMRLPKLEYMGTGAAFFLLMNLIKVPFMVSLGLITRDSLELNLALAPVVLAGAWLGRWLFGRINQGLFEVLALALALGAGARMIF